MSTGTDAATTAAPARPERRDVLAVFRNPVATYLYWTEANMSRVTGIQPRYFTPLLVLIPVAIGSLPFRWADTGKARFPGPVLLVPTLLVFCVILTYRMC